MREIVSTAQTLGYDKSHEFIFKSMVDIADQLDGEWIGFEDFLTMLTNSIVLFNIDREMLKLKNIRK